MNPTKEQLVAYFSGELAAKEKELVEAWLNDQPDNTLVETCLRIAMEAMPDDTAAHAHIPESTLHAYMRFRELAGMEAPPAAKTKLPALPTVRETPVKPVSRSRTIFRYVAAVAASVLLAVGIMQYWNYPASQKQSAVTAPPYGSKVYTASTVASIMRITLDDGSTVQLFPGATLTISDSFNIRDRTVALNGRGYFDVTHHPERPFYVRSGNISTQVLGTAFDVNTNQHGYTHIVVKAGCVQVAGGNSVLSRVQAGQHLSFSSTSGQWSVQQVDATEYCSWTKGELGFRQTPLRDILPTLELWFHISFRVQRPGILDKKLTFFSRRQQMQEAIEVLSNAAGFRYQIQSDTIIIQ